MAKQSKAPNAGPASSSSTRKRVLDEADIHRGVREVVDLATGAGVRVALAGGVALRRLGSDRFTTDIDFVAEAPIPDLPKEGELTIGGYRSHTASGVPVGVILRDDDYQALYEEALQYARRDPDGVPVVGPEYLAAMKLVARRPKDRADLEMMIVERMFDVPKARRIIKRLLGAYAAEDFESFVQVARWRARTGRG